MNDEQLRVWNLLLSYFTATTTLAEEYAAKKLEKDRFTERVVQMSKDYAARLQKPGG